MKKTLLPALLAALLLGGCSQESQEKPKSNAGATNATNQVSSGNPITAPVDYLGAVNQAQKHSVKVLDTAQLNNAIRLFQAAEDRYPKTLNELVTEGYLPKLPEPPRGYRLAYNPQTGQVRIWRPQPQR